VVLCGFVFFSPKCLVVLVTQKLGAIYLCSLVIGFHGDKVDTQCVVVVI